MWRRKGVMEYSPSPASSIGKDSDGCGGREEVDENEVQSSFGGRTRLDLGALEQTLPHSDRRNGLSKCYVGKAMSFSDLGKAESITHISELQKSEHAVNKRRWNEIAITHVWDRSGGISKRSTTSLAMEGGSAGSEEGSCSNSPSSSSPNSRSSRHPNHLPPRYTGVGGRGTSSDTVHASPMRSFSMADLHYFTPAFANLH